MEYPVIDSSKKHFFYQESARSGKLSIEEYGIYCYLLQYLNQNTNTAYPTLEMMCDDLNTTKKRIIKILKSLKEKGFIDWERGNSHKANTYFFPLHYTKMNDNKSINTPSTISCKDSKNHTKGKYTKEEIEDFKINLSLGADYPELREYLEWLSSSQD